jgi:poly(3-hydroxybutyrate) depolymerase
MYVQKSTTAGTMNRVYRVWLPAGYDPKRPYRTIFLGHGCGDNNGCSACGPAGTPFPGLETVADAILVAMVAEGSCFDNGNGTNSSPELVYFDQILKEVAADYCVDQARVFVGGFSSGAWVTHLIGCARAGSGPGTVRAQITATGEWPNPPPCTGPIAALMAHDMEDNNNPFSAGVVARDKILAENHCGTQTIPYSYDGVTPATPTSGNCAITGTVTSCQPCVEYQGCDPGYPVIWCPTNGNNPSHSRQVPITTLGLWRFIQQF